MAGRKRDTATLDWLDPASWTPPEVEERFDPERVRAANLPAKVSRVIAEALRNSGRPRDEVATELSRFTGENITVSTLDSYTSEAKTKNNIPVHRLIALIIILKSPEILNELLADSPFMVVNRKYKPLIERELATELKEHLDRIIGTADSAWRAAR